MLLLMANLFQAMYLMNSKSLHHANDHPYQGRNLKTFLLHCKICQHEFMAWVEPGLHGLCFFFSSTSWEKKFPDVLNVLLLVNWGKTWLITSKRQPVWKYSKIVWQFPPWYQNSNWWWGHFHSLQLEQILVLSLAKIFLHQYFLDPLLIVPDFPLTSSKYQS